MQAQTPPPPAPPAPPPPLPGAPATPAIPDGFVVEGVSASGSPAEIYQAFRAERSELRSQLSQLEEKRLSIARRLREGEVDGADKAGLEARLTELDARIALVDKEIARADAQVAKAAAVPGATVERPRPRQEGPPEEAYIMGGFVLMAAVIPISVAYARRIWRRATGSHGAPAPMPAEMGDRFAHLEDAVEAIAIEVERVGEGQRYLTRLLGGGAAEPVGGLKGELQAIGLRTSRGT